MAQILNNTYEILEFIGKGGMSTVFKARHIRLDMEVAVKAVRKDQQIDLLAEVRVLTKLNHPNLVRVIDIFEDEKLVYIVMDYVEGEDLQHIIQREKVIPEGTVIEWFKTLADALCYLHTRKPPIIYRDMKPANVILQKDGTLKIIDFGIAREYKAQASGDTTYVGTNGFAAPEQFGLAQSDGRTDIYSLGMTMYYLATGKSPLAPPYGYTPARQLNPNISEKLERILEKCIKDNPEDRYQSAEELLLDLNDGITLPLMTAGFQTAQMPAGGTEAQNTQSFKTAELNQTAGLQQMKTIPSKKPNIPLIGGICAAAVLIAGIFFIMPKGSSQPSQHASAGSAGAEKKNDSAGQIPSAEITAEPADSGSSENEAAVSGGDEKGSETSLVYAVNGITGKFSPFFADASADQDVVKLTSLSLLTSDRQGAVVEKGIQEETRSYRGTDYTYYGPADLTITKNADGSADYDFILRDNLLFSDGTPVTADDVIFSMYVLADPAYTGESDFRLLPIEGLYDYRKGMVSLSAELIRAGRNNTNFDLWDRDTQTAFWEDLEKAGDLFVQEICDYLVVNGYCAENADITEKMSLWGFDVPSGSSKYDAFMIMLETYDNDLGEMISAETAGSQLEDLLPEFGVYQKALKTGDSADSISGISKIDDYCIRVRLTEFNAVNIYKFCIPVAPLHYYGETEKYDYERNMFGFEKGDLSHIRSVSDKPLGAGPYRFLGYEDGTVSFEANEYYWKGTPKTENVSFIERTDNEAVNMIAEGKADITEPNYTYDLLDTIHDINGSTETAGPVLMSVMYDMTAYGLIGIGADQVSVNGEPGSEQSKNLRKAFAVILSVYRDASIDSYYGERASLNNYPVSATSWAAPQPEDSDYETAFSRNADGSKIYTSGMGEEERYEAAAEAALEYFRAAGCTVKNGKVTAAPKGVHVNSSGQIEYEICVPGNGIGDHPSYMIAMLAKEALENMNVSLVITDTDGSEMFSRINDRDLPMWCMAWNPAVDPDMYQLFYSDIENGVKYPGGLNDYYMVQDAKLDSLIVRGRASADLDERKGIYREALGIIADWAVEIPVYQRKLCTVFSTERVDIDTVTPDITSLYGWMEEIENIEMR